MSKRRLWRCCLAEQKSGLQPALNGVLVAVTHRAAPMNFPTQASTSDAPAPKIQPYIPPKTIHPTQLRSLHNYFLSLGASIHELQNTVHGYGFQAGPSWFVCELFIDQTTSD